MGGPRAGDKGRKGWTSSGGHSWDRMSHLAVGRASPPSVPRAPPLIHPSSVSHSVTALTPSGSGQASMLRTEGPMA